jgi:sulfur relay (sulfurtransferase) complex TusBCD TusD component (DsrE family)
MQVAAFNAAVISTNSVTNFAPVITLQPTGVTNGTMAGFTVSLTATGTPTLVCQWRLGGTNISGATTSSYRQSPATTTQSGNYTCVVTNSFGSVMSAVATVLITNALLPSIALTAPVNGTSYAAPATLNLAASVTANGHAITQVQFYNGATLLGTVATTPYNFSWTNVSAGSYSLTAQAVFDSGSTVASTAANVTVSNVPLPYIALISPTNGASYLAPATISLVASVTTNGRSISKVQFYNGATLLGTATQTPCSLSWTNVSAGSYGVTAQAVYDSGGTVSSATASVMIQARKHPRLRISMSAAWTGATPATVPPPPPLTILDATDGDPGLTYNLQFSPDLSTWAQIDAMTLDATGCCHLTNSVGAAGANGFYRLQEQ